MRQQTTYQEFGDPVGGTILAFTSGGGSSGSGSPHLSFSLERGVEAATSARDALQPLRKRLPGGLFEDVRLLVTELVTNSVRHSDSPAGEELSVKVFVDAKRVRVEVGDRGSGFEPRARQPGQSRAGGWGLHLVDRMSDAWGVHSVGGTLVWFELERA